MFSPSSRVKPPVSNYLFLGTTPSVGGGGGSSSTNRAKLDPDYELKRDAWRQAWQKDYDALVNKPNRTPQEDKDLETLKGYDKQDQQIWSDYLARCSLYSSDWGNTPFPDGIPGDSGNRPPTNPSSPATKPDETKDGVEIFNKSKVVELYADPSSPIKKHEIIAPESVTLHASSFEDEVVLQKDPNTGSITVTIYKSGSRDPQSAQVYTIKPPLPQQILIDALPNKIKWVDPVKGGEIPLPLIDGLHKSDPAQFPDSPEASKIFVYSSKNPPKETDLVSTKPDRKEGDSGIFSKSPHVEIQVGQDPSLKSYRIYAPGTTLIHKNSNADQVNIEPNLFGRYTVTVLRDGDPNQKETYEISDPSLINLDFDISQVKYKGQPYTIGVDAKIKVEGEDEIKEKQQEDKIKAFAAQLGIDLSKQNFDDFLDSFVAEFNEAFPDSPKYNSPADKAKFLEWFSNKDNWFKTPPEQGFIKVLMALNPKLKNLADQCNAGEDSKDKSLSEEHKFYEISNEMVKLLRQFYPGTEIKRAAAWTLQGKEREYEIGIKFGGQVYELGTIVEGEDKKMNAGSLDIHWTPSNRWQNGTKSIIWNGKLNKWIQWHPETDPPTWYVLLGNKVNVDPSELFYETV